MAHVVLDKIYKNFPARRGEAAAAGAHTRVLRGIDLTVRDGEFLVLVGPSGCGKSTLLRTIAGLEPVTAGHIYVGDRLVNALPPKERDIAMVFQSYALYPHLSVYDNIAFGLRRTAATPPESAGLPWQLRAQRAWAGLTRSLPAPLRYDSPQERAIAKQVRAVAQLLQIEPLLARRPRQLSGGQKQRVALGRAIARNPQVFLMDEPLSNLDAKLRAETRAQIVALQRQLGTTTIYVTHDQTEAMTMGDRIAVMQAGEIQQLAEPLTLYNQPANRFVAEFIGSPPMNFLPVLVQPPSLVAYEQFRLTLPPERWEPRLQAHYGQTLWLGIRPEHLQLSPAAPKNLAVSVELVEALGHDTYLTVHLCDDPDLRLQVRVPPTVLVRAGETLWLSLQPEKVHLFDPQTGRNLWQTG